MNQVGSTVDLTTGYASLSTLEVKSEVCVFGHKPSSPRLDVYQVIPDSPWLRKLVRQPEIGSGLDIVEPFVIGNHPHLLCYAAENGTFEIYALGDELSVSRPYKFSRYREPGLSQGFTTLKSFTCLDQVVFLGYNGNDGHVAMYTLAVTASSATDIPPLRMKPVWSHYWAKGWTRFAFFQFGGENFFLKTNTWKPNVNIDHVLDDLSGAVPVGTYLDLKNAQELTLVQSFKLQNGDPHFLTYQNDGEITLNRLNSDCLGWTTVASFKSKPNATQAIPIHIEDKMLLFIT